MAIAAGADALGLVAQMPSGPGPIPDERIAAIIAGVPPPIATFLLTSRRDPDEVVDHVRRCAPSVVQLVDSVPAATYAALRRGCPGVKIVQVVHVAGEAALAEAQAAAPVVDTLLLDSGRPDLPIKELGGTGRVHDWEVSARIVATCGRPVFLAGGLHADNIAAALAAVRPFGVDLCSGVRSGGHLDAGRLRSFFAALGRAERSG